MKFLCIYTAKLRKSFSTNSFPNASTLSLSYPSAIIFSEKTLKLRPLKIICKLPSFRTHLRKFSTWKHTIKTWLLISGKVSADTELPHASCGSWIMIRSRHPQFNTLSSSSTYSTCLNGGNLMDCRLLCIELQKPTFCHFLMFSVASFKSSSWGMMFSL